MWYQKERNNAAKETYEGSNSSYRPGKEEKKNKPKKTEERVTRCHDVEDIR